MSYLKKIKRLKGGGSSYNRNSHFQVHVRTKRAITRQELTVRSSTHFHTFGSATPCLPPLLIGTGASRALQHLHRSLLPLVNHLPLCSSGGA